MRQAAPRVKSLKKLGATATAVSCVTSNVTSTSGAAAPGATLAQSGLFLLPSAATLPGNNIAFYLFPGPFLKRVQTKKINETLVDKVCRRGAFTCKKERGPRSR